MKQVWISGAFLIYFVYNHISVYTTNTPIYHEICAGLHCFVHHLQELKVKFSIFEHILCPRCCADEACICQASYNTINSTQAILYYCNSGSFIHLEFELVWEEKCRFFIFDKFHFVHLFCFLFLHNAAMMIQFIGYCTCVYDKFVHL
jgi:hypothetical protein